MSALLDLLDTLQAAKVGSRDLDRAIWQGFGSPRTKTGVPSLAGLLGLGMFSTDLHHAVKLATSVLAALTKVQIETYVDGEFHHCEIESDDGEARANNAPNPAMAVVIATVKLLTSAPSTSGGGSDD